MSNCFRCAVIWQQCVKGMRTCCSGLRLVFFFFKYYWNPETLTLSQLQPQGILPLLPIHQDHPSISWWHLKQKQRNHSRGSIWKTISLMPFFILDAWLWISIPNAGWFLLPGSDWESVEGCLSYLMLGISQAVNSIWASLPPLMFSTIYNESFGRHLKPCKVLNH